MNDTSHIRRLTRSEDEKLLFGVCGGLARHFDVDPIVARIAFTAFAFALGSGIVLYFVAALIMPKADGSASVAEDWLEGRDRSQAFIGAALVIAAISIIVSDLTGDWGWDGGGFNGGAWIIALVVAGSLLWRDQRRRRAGGGDDTPPTPVGATAQAAVMPESQTVATAVMPPQPTPRKLPKARSLTLPGFAVLLAASGTLGLLAAADVTDVPVDIALAGMVIAIGVAAVVGVQLGYRAGGLVLLGVLLAGVAGVASLTDVKLGDGAGERVITPAAASKLRDEYRLGAGSMQIDLTKTALPDGTTPVKAHVGMGELVVTVPPTVGVAVDSHVSAGEVKVFGHLEDGMSVDLERRTASFASADRRIELDLDVGFGSIRVERSEATVAG